MKILAFIFLIIPLLSSAPVNVVTRQAIIKNAVFSPLYLDDISVFHFEIIATSSSKMHLQLKIINDLYPSGKELINEIFSSSCTYDYSYDNRFTYLKNNIEFSYWTNDKTPNTYIKTLPLSLPSYQYFDDENSIESKSTLLTFTTTKGWSDIEQTYNFINFNEYYVPIFYHKVDLSEFKIKMPANAAKIFSCDAILIVQNYLEEGNLSIDLTPVQENETTFYLKPKNDLYVEKNTLEMSTSYKGNYVKTRHFYLPRNKMRNQNEYIFNIFFTSFGIDNSIISYSFVFNALSNTIGDCISSEYCVLKENL